MAKSIFELVTAAQIASYWTTLGNAETNLTEALFPANKQLGINLKWIKGSKGRPVVLKASAFDAFAIPRPRIGFSTIQSEMPLFKESLYIDEELRQELNRVLMSDNQGFIDAIITRVFDDEMRLLVGAAARREQMRTMALTTGVISMVSNGQNFTFDYGVTHKADAASRWSTSDADPLEDIRIAKDTIQAETGELLTRAMCDGISWRNLRNNEKIGKAVAQFTFGTGTAITDQTLKTFISAATGLEVVVNYQQFVDDTGMSVKYMPDNTFVMFPDGNLGQTWFGTTPAESDLMGSSIANVAIVDTGVAITTVQKADPVQVETIVSQICLPSLERADSIYILDTNPA